MPTTENPGVHRLRERLKDTRLPADPTRVVLPAGSDAWPDDMRQSLSRRLKPAGVLIPIIEREPHMNVLLTRRSAALKHHASQISFPGGRMEPDDDDILATALRETREEVGIAEREVAVLGFLDPLPTVTGYAVTPVVGLVGGDVRLTVDRREVEVAFEVPLDFLLDPRNARASVREVRGHRVPIIEFHHGGHRIWGATAHMLVRLRDKVI